MRIFNLCKLPTVIITLLFCLFRAAPASAGATSVETQTPEISGTVTSSQVSAFTGATAYNIPIVVPAGPGGIKPSISLQYNSVAVDESTGKEYKGSRAQLGKGWSLGGEITIQRDGWGEKFYLVMGGTRELLVKGNDGYYHPRKDNLIRLKLCNNKSTLSYWQIYAKDGTYYELGHTGDSRHVMATKAEYEVRERRMKYTYDNYAWDVNLIRDAQGNQMVFSYAEYGLDGYVANEWITALKQIKYTMRSGSVVGKAFTVDFSLVNPQDYIVETGFTDFHEISCKNYLRYQDIAVKVDGKLQRHYKISYSGDKKSGYKVASVAVYGTDNATAAPPVTFTNDSAGHITAVNNGIGGKTAYTYETFKIDRGSRSSIGSSLESGLYNTRYRVSDATVSDGMRNSYTTRYSYSGERVSEDEYRGHSYVKVTDVLGNYTETWFYQDNARQGAVKQSRSRDAAGNLYGRTENTFQTLYLPYAPALKKVVPGGYVTEYRYDEGYYRGESGEYYGPYPRSTTLTLYGIDKNDKFVTWSVYYDQSDSLEADDYSKPSYNQPASTVGKVVDFSLGYGGIYYINSSGVIIRLKDKKSYSLTGTKFKQLAALNNAEELYAVDTDGNAWRYASGKWAGLKKELKQIDAFRYTSGSVTYRLIYGIGLDDLVYRLENGVWTKTSTIAMKQVEIAAKAVIYAIGLDGRLYWYNSSGGWSAKNADLGQIAGETYQGTNANVWGVGTDGSIDRWYSAANYTECVMPIIGLTALQQTDGYRYDGDATFKQTQVAYAYDTYGNQTKVSNLGDVSVSGDEIYSYIEYINNATSWILGVPKHSYVKDSAGATVAESWNYYSNTYNGTVDYGSSQKYLRKAEQAAVFGSRGNAANPTAQLSYDQYGNIAQVTDALGNSVTTIYDSIYRLFPVCVANALGQKTYTYYYGVNETGDAAFTGYGLFGQVKSAKDINGKISSRVKYDVLGRTVAAWDGVFCGNFNETKPGIIYGYTYWSGAAPNKVVTRKRKDLDSTAYFSSYTYSDGMGRTIQTQTPSEEAGKMMVSGPVDYDKLGRVAKQYVGYKTASNGAYIASPLKQNPTAFTYDAVGRVIRTDQPDGTCNRVIYNDYVTTAVDKSGKQLRSTVDAYGRVVKTETFSGDYPTETVYSSTTNEYDALGRLVRTTDAQGNVNTVTYDNLGRKVAMNDMDMGRWSYQYDLLGRLISQTDAKGQTVAMKYDVLGRLIKKTNPDGTYTQWDYDSFSGYTGSNGRGRLLRVYGTAMGQRPVSDVAYFDAYGRGIKAEKTIDGTTYVTQTAYDALNRVTYATYPDGSIVYYTYNENNGGTAKIGSTAGGGQYLKSQVYNEYGLVTAKTLGNNVTLNYTYDPKNFRLTKITAAAGSEVVQNLSYTYDNSGLVTAIADAKNNTNWSYAYDDLHRLTGAKRGTGTVVGTSDIYDKSYVYDNINNITSFEGKAYSYGDSAHKHAVTLAGSEAYAYDANGNQTSGADRTIAWNYDNKPLSVTKAGVTTEFAYDGNGTRVKKATGSQWKIYVGGSYEKDQDGKETCYIDTVGVSVKKKADGSLYFILKDHLSGTNVITDAAGKVVARQLYQPYGLDDTVGSFENEVDDHKFTGQEEDTETGLYNYGARFYDPALGRFISADPVEGSNRYLYCANNPVNMVDPSGYQTEAADSQTATTTIQDLYNLDPDSMKNQPIQISVTDNTVNIKAYIEFTGNADETFPDTDKTYAEVAREGIEEYWTTALHGTDYDFAAGIEGKVVTKVITPDECDNPEQKYTQYNIDTADLPWYAKPLQFLVESKKHDLTVYPIQGWSISDPGMTYLYKFDTSYSHVYDETEFKAIAAHHFGHKLGLSGDIYPDNVAMRFQDNAEVHTGSSWGAPGIMSSDLVTNGRVLTNDVEMVLEAFLTKTVQFYTDNMLFEKSSVIRLPQTNAEITVPELETPIEF